MNDFIPCLQNSCINGFIKKEVQSDDGSSYMYEEPCDCYIKWSNKTQLKWKLSNANIPLKVIDWSFIDYKGNRSKPYIEALERFSKNIPDNPQFFYFYGKHGTQKSTIAFLLGKELVKKYKDVFYVAALDLIAKRFHEYTYKNKNEQVDQFIERITNCDFLIIDECFSKKDVYGVSSSHVDHVLTFLKERIEQNRRSTLLISNCSLEEIKSTGYTERIEEMIKREFFRFPFLDHYESSKNDFDVTTLFQ